MKGEKQRPSQSSYKISLLESIYSFIKKERPEEFHKVHTETSLLESIFKTLLKKETLEEFQKVHAKTSLLGSTKKDIPLKVFYYELREVLRFKALRI